MPFLLRYRTDTAGAVWSDVQTLSPNPTEVEYPETRELNVRTTQDSAVIIQRPLADSRVRKWIWKGYRASITVYETLWNNFKALEARARDLSDPEPTAPFTLYVDSLTKIATIQIWENITNEGGFGKTDDGLPPEPGHGNLVWTTVKLIQVHRKSRSGGGTVTYETSTVEFVIADPAWENF